MYLRIISVITTVCAAALVYSFKIPNPMMILIIPVVFFTYADGYCSGGISGLISFAYSLYFFSNQDALFSYSPLNAQKVIIIGTCILLIVLLMGRLKKNEKIHLHELGKLNERLQSFAFVDPLTGAYNRHALVAHLGRLETETASGLSFAVLDLDYFKDINDKYGHMAGDAVLKHVVTQTWKIIPGNSNIYRLGGEEFLIVLKSPDRQRARGIFEEIRQKLACSPILFDGHEIYVTVSIGFHSCAQKEYTVQESIRRADRHLYEAKNAGRNRLLPE